LISYLWKIPQLWKIQPKRIEIFVVEELILFLINFGIEAGDGKHWKPIPVMKTCSGHALALHTIT
jgi:hypothetical protein